LRPLQNLLESAVDGRAHGNTLVEVDGSKSTLGDARGGELELGVHLLVGTRSTEAVQAELLVRVALPTHGGASLDGQHGDTVGQDGEAVLLGLGIENLEARNGHNTGSDTVLLLEVSGSLNGDADLGTGGDNSDGSVGGVDSDVATLEGVLESGELKLGQVLTGQGHDGRSVLGGDGGVVGSGGLVTVGGTPHHAVRKGTEVSQGLNRLVSGAILTQTDGVVGSDVNDTNTREGRQAEGTGGVGDEVQESTTSGDDGAVGSKTVHDGSHGVLTHTVADVATGPLTDAKVRRLEVDSVLPAGVVRASQIGGTRDQLGKDIVNGLEAGLGELTGSDSGVGRLVDGQLLLPALGQLAGKTASEVSTLGLVLSRVLLEELVPLLLLGGTLSGVRVVLVVDLLGNSKGLLGVEAEQLLNTLGIIGLEGVTVDTAGTGKLGAETNGGGQLDDGGLVGDLLTLADGSLDTLEIVVTILDPLGVPAVGLEALEDILGEGTLGVTVCEAVSSLFPWKNSGQYYRWRCGCHRRWQSGCRA